MRNTPACMRRSVVVFVFDFDFHFHEVSITVAGNCRRRSTSCARFRCSSDSRCRGLGVAATKPSVRLAPPRSATARTGPTGPRSATSMRTAGVRVDAATAALTARAAAAGVPAVERALALALAREAAPATPAQAQAQGAALVTPVRALALARGAVQGTPAQVPALEAGPGAGPPALQRRHGSLRCLPGTQVRTTG